MEVEVVREAEAAREKGDLGISSAGHIINNNKKINYIIN